MTERLADMLLDLREMQSVPEIKNVISDLTDGQIRGVISHYEEALKKKKSLSHCGRPKLSEIKRGTLEDYQTIGATYMYLAKGVLLGDEVGLGKTVQAAALYNLLKEDRKQKGKPFRMLFITENSAASEIRDKLVKFTADFFYLLPTAQKAQIDKLFKYDESFDNVSIVAPHSSMGNQQFLSYVLQGNFDAVIFDEGSVIRKKTNEIYKGAAAIFKEAEYRIILNATPIEIHLTDIYNQLDLLDFNYMPYMKDFEPRFVKKRQEGYIYKTVGYKNQAEFFRLIQLRYLARSREQLGAEFTNNQYRVIVVPLSPEQKKIITQTTLKNQLCDCPSSIYPQIPTTRETTPKLDAVTWLVNTESLNDRTCLVYCYYKEAQRYIQYELEQEGHKVESINSETKDRSSVTARIQDGTIGVIVSTVYRALDVGKVDTVIIYSLDSNPQTMRQFEGRITRSFNVKDKKLYILASEGYELTTLESSIKMRIKASKAMTVAGSSMLYDAILDKEARYDWTPEGLIKRTLDYEGDQIELKI